MSNKTSDKNVVNIEEDIKYVKEMLEIARVFFKAVKAETNYKDVDDVAFCNAVEHILTEREQDKKRIQELEADLYSANCTISDYVDSIPKQKVKDKIGVLEVEEKYDYLDNKKAIQTLEELLEDK